MCRKIKKLVEHYRISDVDGEDDIRKCNALMRSTFAGIVPEELDSETWAERMSEVFWLEERKAKMYKELTKTF